MPYAKRKDTKQEKQEKKQEKKAKEEKKKKKHSLSTVLIFIVSLAVFLYPSVSNIYNQYRNSQLASHYADQVKRMNKVDIKRLMNEAKLYNRQHRKNMIQGGSIMTDLSNNRYKNLLSLNSEGVMGILTVPKIHVKLGIYHGMTQKSLSNGCGHVEGTSLPVGGKSTHCVLAAHRGLATAKLFTDLDRLKTGDIFYIQVFDRTLAYKVDQTKTVDPDNLESLKITENMDYVTLMTCTPYGVNTERLLVRGHRIPVPKNAKNDIGQQTLITPEFALKCLAAGLAVLAFVLVGLRKKRNK